MPEVTSSPGAEHSPDKANRVRDMAARLLAELFYKQVIAERELKRRQLDDAKLHNIDNKDS